MLHPHESEERIASAQGAEKMTESFVGRPFPKLEVVPVGADDFLRLVDVNGAWEDEGDFRGSC